MTIDEAFSIAPRSNFLPRSVRLQAGLDVPLSIGFNQTNSQPSTVRQMLQWLDAHPGDSVLDVGSGSGWTSALLAKIVEPNGRVFAVEKIPELVEFGRTNCGGLGITNVRFFKSKAVYGLPEYAPFTRILVSAAAGNFPEQLFDQLAVHGKIVVPVGNSILEITKTSPHEREIIEHPGFVFVPLVRD